MRDKQTYLDIKALYPDHIVFVQSPLWVGKYETYDADAAIARRCVNIPMTWYAITVDDTFIVSDANMRQGLIRDLVSAGYRVAVVDKFEPKTSDMDDSSIEPLIAVEEGNDAAGYTWGVDGKDIFAADGHTQIGQFDDNDFAHYEGYAQPEEEPPTSDMDDSTEFIVMGHIGPDSEGYKTPAQMGHSYWSPPSEDEQTIDLKQAYDDAMHKTLGENKND